MYSIFDHKDPAIQVMRFLILITFFFVCGHFGHGDIPGPLTTEFIAQKWYRGGSRIKFANRGDPLSISCETNSPNAIVRLLYDDDRRRRWVDAMENSKFIEIIKIGQTFLIPKLGLDYSGFYKCVATNWNGNRKELEKGKLIVNPVQRKRLPEIFPNVPVLRVNPYDDVTFSCQTEGARRTYNSLITWYRRNKDGTLTRVDGRSAFRSRKVVAGNPIDIQKIKFTRFSEKDVGTYVCVRKAYRSTPTEKDIRLEINRAVYYGGEQAPMFAFETQKWNLKDRVPIKVAMLRQFFFISCQTNDPQASVSLLRTQDKSSEWKKMTASTERRFKQIGQTFLLTGLTISDTSYYKCRAIGNYGEMIELEKGFLVVGTVRNDYKPEIFPSSSIIRVRRRDAITVTCKAIGVIGNNSFLKWYRNYDDKYVYVKNENIQRTKEKVGGNHVDVEKLVLRNFNDDDIGVYTCVRKVASSKPTTASTRIVLRR